MASQPPVIILQGPSAAASPQQTAAPSQSLLIELQGDRYVRVRGEAPSETEVIDPSASSQSMPQRTPQRTTAQSNAAVQPAGQTPTSVVLIFRDGHREEISDYTIADGVLYARADYYSDGSWNKSIKLQSLNLPDTIQSNQSRGIRFQLPSAANVVVVGP